MKEPGLDGRHRDKNPPKAGEIQQKRSDTLNKNLPLNSAERVIRAGLAIISLES
jgi:hypothetical protein